MEFYTNISMDAPIVFNNTHTYLVEKQSQMQQKKSLYITPWTYLSSPKSWKQ